jgi:hypothetical protein
MTMATSLKSLSLAFLASTSLGATALPALAQEAPAAPAVTPVDVNAACRTVNNDRRSFLLFNWNRRNESTDRQCVTDMTVIQYLTSDDHELRMIGVGEYLRRTPEAQATINELAAERYAIQNLQALVFSIRSARPGGSEQDVTCSQQMSLSSAGNVVFNCAAPADQAPATEASTAETPAAETTAPATQLSMTAPRAALGHRFG